MTVPLERQKNIADVAPRVREKLGLGTAAVSDASAFATSEQGEAADLAWEIAEANPTPQMFGGRDDGVTDNVAAFSALIASKPNFQRVRLPRVTEGVYYFSTDIPQPTNDASKILFDPEDDGIVVKGPVSPRSGYKSTRPLRFDVTAGGHSWTFWLNNPLSAARGLSAADAYLDTPSLIDCTIGYNPGAPSTFRHGLRHLKTPLPQVLTTENVAATVTDTFTDAGVVPVVDGVIRNITPDGQAYASFTGIDIGEQISVSFDPDGADPYRRLMVVQGDAGFHIFGADAGGGLWLVTKLIGSPATYNTVGYYGGPGRDDAAPEWAPNNVAWGIQKFSAQSYMPQFNGVSLLSDVFGGIGYITSVGFGAQGLSGSVDMVTNHWTRTRTERLRAPRRLGISVFGDSRADGTDRPLESPFSGVGAFQSAWPELLAKLLNGTAGIDIGQFMNFAVGGANTPEQIAVFDTWSSLIGGGDLVVWATNTNDAQAGRVIGDYLADVAGIKARTVDVGRKLLIVNCPTWTSKENTPGADYGLPTFNNVNYYRYRKALEQYCSKHDIAYLDLQPVFNQVLGRYQKALLTKLFDNIHFSQIGAEIAAQAIGQAVIQMLAPKITKVVNRGALSSRWLAAGMTTGDLGLGVDAGYPSFSIDESRRISFDGWLVAPNSGSLPTNSSALWLPPIYAPAHGEVIGTICGTNGPNFVVRLFWAFQTGEVRIPDMAINDRLSLSQMSWQLPA